MVIQICNCNHLIGEIWQQAAQGRKVVVDKEFNSCKWKDIWPVTNGLQKMLRWSTIIVNAKLGPVMPRIPQTST
jgi:hypothetical protein